MMEPWDEAGGNDLARALALVERQLLVLRAMQTDLAVTRAERDLLRSIVDAKVDAQRPPGASRLLLFRFEPRVCKAEGCGATFTPHNGTHRFCAACKAARRIQERRLCACGKRFRVSLQRPSDQCQTCERQAAVA